MGSLSPINLWELIFQQSQMKECKNWSWLGHTGVNRTRIKHGTEFMWWSTRKEALSTSKSVIISINGDKLYNWSRCVITHGIVAYVHKLQAINDIFLTKLNHNSFEKVIKACFKFQLDVHDLILFVTFSNPIMWISLTNVCRHIICQNYAIYIIM